MGTATCNQYCETCDSDKVCVNGWNGNGQGDTSGYILTDSVSVLPLAGGRKFDKFFDGNPTYKQNQDQEMQALNYHPPPVAPPLGSPMLAAATTMTRSPPTQSLPSSSRIAAAPPSWARPGEPVNKVYVQFSNDLEGFLPYTLVISEANGLSYTALGTSPDFTLDPLNIMKVSRVDFDTLMQDAFFTNLSKSIQQSIQQHQRVSSERVQECVKPPYRAIVQLSVRRTMGDACQVLVFIAVQTDHMAEELMQSCSKLQRRRAPNESPVRAELSTSSGSVSRGCPTPRTAVMQSVAARATPPRTPQQATREILAGAIAPPTPPQMQIAREVGSAGAVVQPPGPPVPARLTA